MMYLTEQKTKRFDLWKCNDHKNGVVDRLDNAYYLDEEIVDKMNYLEDAKIQVIKDNNRLKNKITQLETQISHLKWENNELRERGLEMKYEDDLKTINQDIKEIYLILIELESLETGENADYTDISTDIGYCKMLLKDRLISLKRKAETEGAII